MGVTETPLAAPLNVGFDYTRSTGPVLGRFVNALRERRIEGVRGSDGRVHVPPVEYDPVTADPLSEFVEVATEGAVMSWTWMTKPLEGQPLSRPFAWALIKLDGADTAMLHAVDSDTVHTGLRVRVQWAAETVGHIRDIAYFVPVGSEDTEPTSPPPPVAKRDEGAPVSVLMTP